MDRTMVNLLQRVRRNRMALIFGACCIWIAAVSVHDAVLVVVNHEEIEQYEQNPVRSKYLADIQIGTKDGLGRDIEGDSRSVRRLDGRAASQEMRISVVRAYGERRLQRSD